MTNYNEIIGELQKRKVQLEASIAIANKKIEKLPEGKLRISYCRGNPQYYKIIDSADTHGKYIKKSDFKIAQELAQKDYLKKIIDVAQEELKIVKRAIGAGTNFPKTKEDNQGIITPEAVYDSLKKERKILVSPLLISDDEYARRWSEEQFRISTYKPEEKIYTTRRDEMVRSKSEMVIADMYFEIGVPYRYECELRLKSGVIKYPDFTLLNKRTREVIYHEHLGRMDDEKYRKKNLRKIEEYRRNGIFVGKNLILTFEEDGCPFNIREFEKSIREII